MNSVLYTEIDACAAHLLAVADFDGDSFSLTPLRGGRNNRVFRVNSPDGVHLMKLYFHPEQDTRDRLGHETAFLHHLELSGCTVAPHLFASIPADYVALLEYIDGSTLALPQIDAECVDQAAEFYLLANTDRGTSAARALPIASEACFSISEHLAMTERRVNRLNQILVNDELDVAADLFARTEITEVWQTVRANIFAEWPKCLERDAPLPANERCLSPSDFGFHNALREASGRIRFLDFEYAGWDDPAKLICDFANQPDLPLPAALSARFRDVVISAHHNPGELRRRVAALSPLFQVKWACICLNDFLCTGRQRHDFTQGIAIDNRPRRELQLRRARQMLARATSVL